MTDDRVARLQALVKTLGLTEKQQRVCEETVRDPSASQGAVGLAAGLSASSANVTVSKWLKLNKVQAYISALRDASGAKDIERAQVRGAVEAAEWNIATLGEVLNVLTGQMRYRPSDFTDDDGSIDWAKVKAAPPGLFRGHEVRVTTDKDGGVTRSIRLLAESPQGAAKELRAHFVAGNTPPPPPGATVNILALFAGMPLEQLREIRGKLMEVEGKLG